MKPLVSTLLLLLLALSLIAEEAPKITLDAKDRPLADLAAEIAKSTGRKVEVSDSLKRRPITLKVTDEPLPDVLAKVVKLAAKDGEVAVLPDGTYRLRRKHEDEDPATRIARLLDETKVDIDFEETPLAQAVRFLADCSGCPICIDPGLKDEKTPDELTVDLKASGLSVRDALGLIVLTKGLAWDVRWGAVFLGAPGRLKALPKEPLPLPAADASEWEQKLRKQLARRVTFDLEETNLLDAIAFLRTRSGVNVVVAPDDLEAARSTDVDLAASDLPLADALAQLLLPRGFRFCFKDKVVWVARKVEKR